MDLFFIAIVSIFCYSFYIRIFKKISQYEREEGLRSHKVKNGTITMGGIIFALIPPLFIIYDQKVFNIVLTVSLFSVIGLIDDFLIVIKKNNTGIKPSIKLLLEVLIAAISFYLFLDLKFMTTIHIFNYELDIKWLYGLLILLILTSSTNAFNLTDGIDGLCSGLSLIISFGFLYIAYIKNEMLIFYMIICYMIPLFVFWCFNFPKAFLFMGDTGSLFLGAFYAMLSIYLDCIIPFIFMSLIFIFETISVILQVFYFKKTNGKRLFKMAPFHHHLELCGFKEYQIDFLLYFIQIIFVALCIIIFY